ncbi:Abi-alpha family protein [Mucilaginibacter arboris]|uniref:DUF4393 domain-containing protein n=1 Tax=Mucilaginibacter arboris TaxID=2682090 RepID=A0A7K1SZT8_9SPHI|nr:Abi-alpha family protein [Mucilaginibacter arboris]MVN22826.1 DUF4393 domain-containing protein [Mucilaginibacter arboris]
MVDIDINFNSSTADKALDMANSFLRKLVGPSLEEVGLTWSDNFKMRRIANSIKNLAKVKKILEGNNIDPKQVNLKVLIPYLENVSLEEDETLQEVWANLFVNYLDASKNLNETVYPYILSQLSTQNIKIINAMANNNGKFTMIPEQKFAEEFVKNIEALPNLIRLGIIVLIPEPNSGLLTAGALSRKVDQNYTTWYDLTSFGWNFFHACTR